MHSWCLPSEHPESSAWLPKSLFAQLPRVTAWSVASRGAWVHVGHSGASPECSGSTAGRPTPRLHSRGPPGSHKCPQGRPPAQCLHFPKRTWLPRRKEDAMVRSWPGGAVQSYQRCNPLWRKGKRRFVGLVVTERHWEDPGAGTLWDSTQALLPGSLGSGHSSGPLPVYGLCTPGWP